MLRCSNLTFNCAQHPIAEASSELSYEPDWQSQEGRIIDNDLTGAAAERQEVELAAFSRQEPSKLKTAAGTGHEYVSVEGSAELFWFKPVTP